MPDLRNAAGEPTGAIYGVLNMLRRLLLDYKTENCAVVFDAKGKTFRDDIYKEYKANRPPMPDDLVQQIEPLHECVRAMGWPLLCIEGVEADDVIGTLVREAEKHGMHCVVSTGDKDLAQLVTPYTRLVNTMTNEILDEEGVVRKFGVPPTRLIDYFTLVGDAVDNVPGVNKVGPKTAVKWLTEHGTLDTIVERAGSIGGVVGENLRKSLDWLPTGRKLVTVDCALQLPVHVEELVLKPRDEARLAQLFERFNFRAWLKSLSGQAQEDVPDAPRATAANARAAAPSSAPSAQIFEHGAAPQRCYELVTTEAALQEWARKLEAAELAAFDTETTGLDPFAARIVGLSFCITPGCGNYVPLMHDYAGAPDQIGLGRALEILTPWLENPRCGKLGQNSKYDQHVLANHGIHVAGIAHDTLLESYVLESHQRHDMDSLAQRVLGIRTISYDDVTGSGAKRIPFSQVSVERALDYAAEDADVTWQLHAALYPRVSAEPKLRHIYENIEMPVREVLFRIERNGVLIDGELLGVQGRELGQRMLELEAKAYQEAGQPFNLNSPKQIAEIFFERKGMQVIKKTPSGAPSTDEEVLGRLALDHPLAKMLLDYREIAKLKSTYTDKLVRMCNQSTGRVHTTYGQSTAVTGRLASNDPNLQNIPVRTLEGRRIREAFIAPPGSVIVSADYSQIELRIMAHISGDENLLRAFAQGEDVHRATAAEIFGRPLGEVTQDERRYAKTINFGLIYGMSAFGLAQNLGLERATAQAYIQSYFNRYPAVKRYMDETRMQARDQGYVETVFGRRLWLPEIRSSNAARRGNAERAAINAPMQGTAADLIKLAMIEVQGWLDREKLASLLIMQVHDELVLEVPENELERITAELPGLMCGVAQLRTPLLVEVGSGANWEKAH